MKLKALLAPALAGTVIGCSSAPAVAPPLQAEAESWVAKEVGAAAVPTFRNVWKMGGSEVGVQVCGDFAGVAPDSGATIRYVYDGANHAGVVEPKERLIALDSFGGPMLALPQANFDETWAKNCEKFRPGWLGRL